MMNISTTIASLLLPAFLAGPVFSGSLDRYEGRHRVIILALPAGPTSETVTAMLRLEPENVEDRDLKVVDISAGAHRVLMADRPSEAEITALRSRFKLGIKDSRPTYILIGKDGGEKSRQLGTMNLEKWFILIDQMPMRREEIKSKPRSSNE